MEDEWFAQLISYVKKKGCVILNFDSELVERASLSKHGFNEFTKSYPHDLIKKISPPQVCFIVYQSYISCETQLNIGILSSNAAISTFESRVKYKNGKVLFSNLKELLERSSNTALNETLLMRQEIIYVKPNIGVELIKLVNSFTDNQYALRYVSASLNVPRTYCNNTGMQEDAIQMVLRTFGIRNNDLASNITLIVEKSTGICRLKNNDDLLSESFDIHKLKSVQVIPFIEDHAIAKDVRSSISSGYTLELDSLTGKTLFEKNGEQLEIYTANRTALEHALGVDLIYINLTQKNTVMVQYKMLEKNENSIYGDWIYYPDEKMENELAKMQYFNQSLGGDGNEYRLNKSAFYLKFVKRDAALRNGSIILPIDHYQKIIHSSRARGPRNGIRISYNQLEGQYLRQGPFEDLIRSGYIGSFSKTTDALRVLINEIIKGNRAVVTAIQRQIEM